MLYIKKNKFKRGYYRPRFFNNPHVNTKEKTKENFARFTALMNVKYGDPKIDLNLPQRELPSALSRSRRFPYFGNRENYTPRISLPKINLPQINLPKINLKPKKRVDKNKVLKKNLKKFEHLKNTQKKRALVQLLKFINVLPILLKNKNKILFLNL